MTTASASRSPSVSTVLLAGASLAVRRAKHLVLAARLTVSLPTETGRDTSRLVPVVPALFLCLLLSGCVERALSPASVLAPDAEARTRAAAEAILSGDIDRVRSVLTTSAGAQEIEASMPTVRAMLDSHVPEPVDGRLDLVHAENRRSDGSADAHPIHQASYEVRRADDVLLVQVAVEDGGPQATGMSWFDVRSMASPITGANDFGTVPPSAGRVAFVAAMALVLAFVVVTAGFVVADRGLARRWLWIPFVLCGMWGLTMDWTTGAVSPNFVSVREGGFRVSPITFTLLGASVERTAYARPWVLEVALPVGALVYWGRRAVRRRRAAAAES